MRPNGFTLLASAFSILIPAAPLVAQRVPIEKQQVEVKTRFVPPAGPAPQNVRVPPGNPLLHALTWDRLAGVSGYRVFKSINGQLYPDSPLILTETWVDTAVVPPGTPYRVTATYADGREGSTDFIYANPPQPQAPIGFTVKEAGPGVVNLSWQAVPYAAWYRVFGTGRPADGTVVYGTTVSFPNLADGTYTWSVSADYGGAHGPGPSHTITLKSSGRYRVVANGFRVIQQTFEFSLANILANSMGANDEVYGGFAMFHVGRSGGQLLDRDLRRTLVHGDVNTRLTDRVQAGTASLTGGLRTGDVVPSVADPSQRWGQPLSDQTFPFVIWDGTLTNGYDAVIVLPGLWESDLADQVFTNWFLAELGELPRIWSDRLVQETLQGKSISLITPPGWTYLPYQLGRMDHSLGALFDMPQNTTAAVAEVGRRILRRAVVLTREMIEAALAVGNGLVTVPLTDGGEQGAVPGGSYILYLQVERVP